MNISEYEGKQKILHRDIPHTACVYESTNGSNNKKVHEENSQLDTVSLSSTGRSNDRRDAITLQKYNSNSNINDRGNTIEFSEDVEHKKRLQLYVFVSRCIAYPFNAKQPSHMARRKFKVTNNNLALIKQRFASFLDGKTNIIADEACKDAIQSYTDTLLRSERVAKMVHSGGYSSNDFRDHFKVNIETCVRNLEDVEGISKETMLSSWMATFDAIYKGDVNQKMTPSRLESTPDSELILSKEQLYEMFQIILGVKEYEHQVLFHACKVTLFKLIYYSFRLYFFIVANDQLN